jgi:hypothetical protein
MKSRLFFVGTMVVLVSACSGDLAGPPAHPIVRSEPTNATRGQLAEISPALDQAGGAKFFPVGTRIPEGQVLTAAPEPYNPSKHGAPIPNTQPSKDLGLVPGDWKRFPKPHSGMVNPPARMSGGQSFPPADPNPDHTTEGFWLGQVTKAWYGVYALQDARTDFTLPYYSNTYPAPEPTLYAPTMQAPGGTCLEAVVIHQAIATSLTKHYMGWSDWCNVHNGAGVGMPSTYEEITPSYKVNYVRTYNGQPTITVYVVTPNTGHTNGQCWSGGVYNYTLGGYEEKANSCGPSQSPFGTLGWTMFEDYTLFYNNDCPSFPTLRSEIIQLDDPDLATGIQFTSYPNDYSSLQVYAACFVNGTYSFRSPAPNTLPNSWIVVTPVP